MPINITELIIFWLIVLFLAFDYISLFDDTKKVPIHSDSHKGQVEKFFTLPYLSKLLCFKMVISIFLT